MSHTLRPVVTVTSLELFPPLSTSQAPPFVQIDCDRALGEHLLPMVSIIA